MCEMLYVCRKGQRRENVAGRLAAGTRKHAYFRSSLELGRAVRNTLRNVALMLRALGYGHFEIL